MTQALILRGDYTADEANFILRFLVDSPTDKASVCKTIIDRREKCNFVVVSESFRPKLLNSEYQFEQYSTRLLYSNSTDKLYVKGYYFDKKITADKVRYYLNSLLSMDAIPRYKIAGIMAEYPHFYIIFPSGINCSQIEIITTMLNEMGEIVCRPAGKN